MIKMRWSPASAKTAQAYANTCSDGASGQGNVGENIYLDWSEKNPSSLDKDGINAAVSWSEQFSYFGWSSTYLDKETLESGIKDAIQMVWAKTGYVGCGVKNCGPDPMSLQNNGEMCWMRIFTKRARVARTVLETGCVRMRPDFVREATPLQHLAKLENILYV
ncbi:hypothetical protein CRE_18879 [Caenorhabditis remanei]|uniref:SCP domain-containing protein n=1 Tax=Caenorhabditis remanei TaxID=31234 RepID=E3LLE0_CAERE|nr:hypothetical protein CRE_18879 [Caenorhabditis remanei]